MIGPLGMEPLDEAFPAHDSIPHRRTRSTGARAFALGEVTRPNLVLAVHLAPYIAPGDLYANKHMVDAAAGDGDPRACGW